MTESLRQRAVASVASKIQERMGPLVGSPEYLADPVKRARSEKRQRDAAEAYAEFAVESALSELLPLLREAGEGLEPFATAAGHYRHNRADTVLPLERSAFAGPDDWTHHIRVEALRNAAAIHAKIKGLTDAEG